MYPYNFNPKQTEAAKTTQNPTTLNIHSKEVKDACKVPPKPDKKLLDMIQMGITDSAQTASFYKTLMNVLHIPNDIEMVRNTYLDELKHVKLLQEIYYIASGEKAPEYTVTPVSLSENILENFQKAIFDSLEAADFYRELYFSFLNLELRDMLFEILTDEQDHAARFNFLFSKYKQ